MPKLKWTYEVCKEEALKYTTKGDYQKYSHSSYNSARKNKWINDICSHMIEIKKPKDYWTKENCIEAANSCKSLDEFRNLFAGAAKKVRENKWEKFLNLKPLKKPNGYWTKENCKNEALKYKTKKEFKENSEVAYNTTNLNNWHDYVYEHFENVGNRYKRYLYAYEFSDNHVYVGLTYNIYKRKRRHKENGTVFEYQKETGIIPTFMQLTFEAVNQEDAKYLEGYYLKQYKEKGWKMLNKAKTGGLGGNIIKWDYDSCLKEAIKYETRTEFCRKNGSAYSSALRNNWLDDICLHMKSLRKNYKHTNKKLPNYWNIERCINAFRECKNISEFKKIYGGAYDAVRRNMWHKYLKTENDL
jgi:predicted GIY-YIG superfamily endonuclease